MIRIQPARRRTVVRGGAAVATVLATPAILRAQIAPAFTRERSRAA